MPAPEKIRHLRQYVGDTQRSAAERVGVARRTWQDWERGVARMPVSAWELYRIRVLTAGTDSV